MSSSDPPRFLLLLPPPPSPATPADLGSAYGDTLTQVLKEVALHSSDSSRAAILEIALAIPHLAGQEKTPRASLFAPTQSMLAGIYGLITRIAAKEGVNVEDQDGVDVRILLVAWSPDQSTGWQASSQSPYGPVISLSTLAKSGRAWQYAFGVESRAGEAFVKAFVEAKGTGETVSHVGSLRQSSKPQPSASNNTPTESPSPSTFHHHIAIGGTFDHIHIGHKLLLTMTVFSLDLEPQNSSSPDDHTITIGITGDQLLKNKKHAEVLESWSDRYNSVLLFLDSILDFLPSSTLQQQQQQQHRQITARDDPVPNGKSMDISYPSGMTIKCTEIQDPFGPTITEERISAMVLTAETRSGGKAVNDKRAEKGWKALDLFEVDVLDANAEAEGGIVKEGFESKLSSTAIREKVARKRRGGNGGSSL